MITKYYSEILHKLFDTVEELEKAEAAALEVEEAKKRKKEEEQKAIEALEKEYNELVDIFANYLSDILEFESKFHKKYSTVKSHGKDSDFKFGFGTSNLISDLLKFWD